MRASRLSLGYPSHAGLALYKYPKGFEPEDKQALLEAIAETSISPAYEAAFERWKDTLSNAVFIEATTATPLAVGLGNSSPLENGLSIHHTYGTPYLPGSAVKGLLKRAADKYNLSAKEQKVLFGEQDEAAHIVYWDGWLEPRIESPFQKIESPFQKDVITVHHQKYYSSKGKDWPTDFDDPNPVAFLSVKPGTKFWLALSSTSEGSDPWLEEATKMLTWALEHLGLGGKTNAGYGYFSASVALSAEQVAEIEQKASELLERTLPRIEKITHAGATNLAMKIANELSQVSPKIRRKTLQRLREQLETHKLWKPDERYYREIQALLEEQ